MWSDYLDATSVHGFPYIHRRNPMCDRILWSIVIFFGFTASSYLIFQAFQDWDENPVLTTLDTIAAPISEIEFPTVTACPDEYAPVDTWAYLETVLNSIHFSCTYGTDEENYNCNKTEKVRQDFKFLVSKILNFYRGFIFKGELGDDFFTINYQEQEKFKYMTVELLRNKSLSMNEFNSWPMKYFLDKVSEDSILRKYGVHLDHIEFWDLPECKDGRCYIVEKITKLIDLGLKDAQFGAFLAHTLTVDQDSKTFIENEYVNAAQIELCNFKTQEVFLQEYFTGLGQDLGLNMSLFELPGIFSRPKESEMTNRTHYKTSSYSTCKLDPDFNLPYMKHCNVFWSTLIEGDEFLNAKHHPCDETANSDLAKICCLGLIVGPENIESVMRVMRLAQRRGQSWIDMEDFLNPHLNSTHLKYDLWGKGAQFILDNNTMIPACIKGPWESLSDTYHREESCVLFEPVLTDLGICQAHNALLTTDYLQESSFRDAFEKVYKTDFMVNKTIDFGQGAGKDHQMEFYLFANNIRRQSLPKMEHFQVAITSNSEYFMLKGIMKKVRIGYRTSFKVQPMEIFPNEDLNTIPINKRRCRLPSEIEGAVERFQLYSQSACQLECNLKMAQKICQCLPWYYPPNPKDPKSIICDSYGNYCFDKLFKDPPKDHKCNCLPNCRDIQYAVNENSEKLDPEVLCNTRKTIEFYLGNWMYSVMGEFIYMFRKLRNDDLKMENDLGDRWSAVCKEMVENDLAIVSVTFETEKYVRTFKDRKVTFIDKLATLGGTLGLFTGMSLLSMVEIAFWLFKGMRRILGKMKVKKSYSRP